MKWLKRLEKLLTNMWFYVALFLFSVVAPFIINELYRMGQGGGAAYVTLWNAQEALAYFGSYLSFLGSMILGAVAVIQTADANVQAKDANKQTERANQLAVQMQRLEQAKFMPMGSVETVNVNQRSIDCPSFSTQGIDNPIIFDMVDSDYKTFRECYHVDVLFMNTSEHPIVEIHAHGKGENRGADLRHGLKADWNDVYISMGEKQALRFLIPSEFFEKNRDDGLRLDLEFVNVFDFHTYAVITIDALAKYSNSTVKKEYTYRIKKITDVKPAEGTPKE